MNSLFYAAFYVAKNRFLRKADDWFLKVIGDPDMREYVNKFLRQLNLYVFSNIKKGPLLLGLSSVSGEFIYVNEILINDMPMLVRTIQHEMVHSFFRYYRLQKGDSKLALSSTISPSKCRNLQYSKHPIHSGYLYDYIFSGRDMIYLGSPFTFLCLEEWVM